MVRQHVVTRPIGGTVSLTGLLRGRTLVLLDFDGPICAAFGAEGSLSAANALRSFLGSRGLQLDQDEPYGDPLGVLRMVARQRPALLLPVDAHLRELECTAVTTAVPSAGSEEFIRATAEAGRAPAVVSNNAGEAIESYLAMHALSPFITAVEGRPAAEPARLKPDPFILQRALDRVGQPPAAAVMIGDSPSDVGAAHALGIPCIGLANKPGKRARLHDARADALCDSMSELRSALP